MRYSIGFDREIKIEWLDEIIKVTESDLDNRALMQHMNEYFTHKGLKGDVIRKTTYVIKKIWFSTPKQFIKTRNEALRLYSQSNDEDKLWLHWGMVLLVYPFFRDIADIIGMLSTLQSEISTEQIRRRFIERRGNRTSALRALYRVIQTMVWWEVLEDSNKKGVYRFPAKITTSDRNIQQWYISTLILTSDAKMMFLDQLFNSTVAFPFKMTIDPYELKSSDQLSFHIEGSGTEMISYKKV
ncbi:MAG: hypothetical protein ACFFD4_35180 [Candidatus Odinarchaeota archaeon]